MVSLTLDGERELAALQERHSCRTRAPLSIQRLPWHEEGGKGLEQVEGLPSVSSIKSLCQGPRQVSGGGGHPYDRTATTGGARDRCRQRSSQSRFEPRRSNVASGWAGRDVIGCEASQGPATTDRRRCVPGSAAAEESNQAAQCRSSSSSSSGCRAANPGDERIRWLRIAAPEPQPSTCRGQSRG